MRSIKYILTGLALAGSLFACTEDFEEINTDPYNATTAPIEGIMAGVQYFEFAEPRFLTWRGNLIYSSQFANQFSYNYQGSWFGADAYQNNQGWTNGMFDNSYKKVTLNARNLLKSYTEIGDENGIAVTRIMMSWFYQKMTDIFGDVPYSELTGENLILENPKPVYDSQKSIYMGIMEDLKAQMDAIGNSTTPINGAEGDYVYGGDPQKWKALANTLRLRMAIRSRDAFIADGEQAFIDGVINDCLSSTLINESNSGLLKRSETPLLLSFLDGGFEDVYWGFAGVGSKFTFTDRYINLLADNNDPRLSQISTPSVTNGEFKGSPIGSRTQLPREDFADPSEMVVGLSTTEIEDLAPIKILSAAESYFLQAEAALLGYGGDANTLYRQGIEASMSFWKVPATDIQTFLSNENIANLSGSVQDQLEMVWNQRWIAALMNGYESWSLVRRTDLIPALTDNNSFFVTQPNNGIVPRRLPYSATEIVSNEENVQKAVQQQGPDEMTTNIWWDIK
ncbi:SusD/RagB family nutrient-binding outer membrane lipoprotein [Galbibacter mesophilus]|uniref:SusD/RagB family nutrient-binding outer membrane lipoprotein n=1 Tax=Galbibacter mesophilus TaxID=379069 RepID=UPI00191FC16E|nr:SusD/RagB family nutrient-binding outer membrane lipoprotein [Galbibacter mesophilus]MCM5661373.1 SusD/RagB family nutrient-binding outer membrane lipoprotein [Galbibacter mesophilus]